jgi:hypothetical protein
MMCNFPQCTIFVGNPDGVGQLLKAWIETGLFLSAAAVVCYGMLTALAMLWLARRGRLAIRLLALCLLLFCATIGHEALLLAGIYDRFPSLRFLPVSLSLAVGPMLFHYVKARLYPGFRLQCRDIKHFLPVLAQVSAYLALWMQSAHRRDDLWEGLYRYYVHPLENMLFVLTGWIYLYFAYRFIKHALHNHRQGTRLLIALRLKRTAKVQFLFLSFYAAYLVDDTIRRLFLLKAQTDLTLVSWFSFTALLGMLFWLSVFAWLSEYWWPRRGRVPDLF